MGIGDKLKFWKKEEDDFSDLGDFGLGDVGSPTQPHKEPNMIGSGMDDPMASAGMLPANPQGMTPPMDGMSNTNMGSNPQGMAPPMQDMNMGATPQGMTPPMDGMSNTNMGSMPQEMGQPQNSGMSMQSQDMSQSTFPSASERMTSQQPVQQQTQPEPMQPPNYPPPATQQSYTQQPYSKDMEIISAKLDSLRATLESINQRLATLERLAQGDSRKKYEW
jgi:hypothetical protein